MAWSSPSPASTQTTKRSSASGKPWKIWKDAMDDAIVGTQRKDTTYCEYKGSWDPKGPWGHDGGRVYSTAVLAMCLQVYFRYDRVFGTK